MAVTIMCGLTFATVLTMVVIPVNYALVFRIPRPSGAAPFGEESVK
jgi:Cu/Ag efflux pump CusA